MKRIIFNFCFVWLAVSAFAGSKVVEMRNYGLVPDTHENLSPKLQKALQDIKSQVALGDKVTLLLNPDVTISILKGRLSVSIIFPIMIRTIRNGRFPFGGLEGADGGRTGRRFYLSWTYASTFSASFRELYFA